MIYLFTNDKYGLSFLPLAKLFSVQCHETITVVFSGKRLWPRHWQDITIKQLTQVVQTLTNRWLLGFRYGLNILLVKDVNAPWFQARLQPTDAGLILGFEQIFHPATIQRFNSLVNFHPSLLPWYRGSEPGYWVLANQEQYTGFTVHEVTEKIDEGQILYQEMLPIRPEDTPEQLYYRIADTAKPTFWRYLQYLHHGGEWPSVQLDASAIYNTHQVYAPRNHQAVSRHKPAQFPPLPVGSKGEVVVRANELRQFLQDKLPDYMIPSAFVIVAAIPLTAHGKIDYSKLPAPENIQTISEENFVAPRTPTEQILATLWGEVLGLKQVSIHDHFFDLGGHSLLATQVVAKIRKACQVEISVMNFFGAPTVAQMAQLIENLRWATQPPNRKSEDHEAGELFPAALKTPTPAGITPIEGVLSLRLPRHAGAKALETIQPQGHRPPFFFIGSTNKARLLAPHLGIQQPVYGLNIFGLQPASGTAVSLEVREIARQYLQEIQMVQMAGPYYLGCYCADAAVAFEIAQQLRYQGQSVAFLAFLDVLWKPQEYRFRHWYTLLKFGLGYLPYKIRQQIKFIKWLLVWYGHKLTAKFYRHAARPVPGKLQNLLFVGAYYKALEEYVPQPYDGRITSFLSQDSFFKYSSELERLAKGGIELHEVPGYHEDLFEMPQVAVLGEQLQRCLEKAANFKIA
jgi:acyl carrier protein